MRVAEFFRYMHLKTKYRLCLDGSFVAMVTCYIRFISASTGVSSGIITLGRNSSKYDKYCMKQTTFLKDMFRHAYAIISLMSLVSVNSYKVYG